MFAHDCSYVSETVGASTDPASRIEQLAVLREQRATTDAAFVAGRATAL
jgi:hypothetical protein